MRAVTGTVWLMSGNMLAKLVGIGVFAFFARMLSPTALVVFPVYAMLCELSILLLSFGLFPNFIRVVPSMIRKDAGKAHGLVLTSIALILPGTAAFSIGVYWLSSDLALFLLHEQNYQPLLQVMTFGFPALAARRIFENLLWCFSRFAASTKLQVFEAIFRAGLLIVLYYLFGIIGVVWGLVINDAVQALLGFLLLGRYWVSQRPVFYGPLTLVQQATPLCLEAFLMYFRNMGDNWVVSGFLGPGALAVYHVAKTIFATLFMFFHSMDQVLTVRLSVQRDNPAYFEDQLPRIARVIAHVAVPIVFFSAGLVPAAIFIIAGPSFMDAKWPAILLCVAVLLHFLRWPIVRSIFLLASPLVRLKQTCFETLLVLVGFLGLTPLYGLSGVAMSQCIGLLGGAIFGYTRLRRRLTINLSLANTLIMLCGSTAMASAMLAVQRPRIDFINVSLAVLLAGGIVSLFVLVFQRHAFLQTCRVFSPVQEGLSDDSMA